MIIVPINTDINTDFTKIDRILINDMKTTFTMNTKKFGDIHKRIINRLHENNHIPCQSKITEYFSKIKEDD